VPVAISLAPAPTSAHTGTIPAKVDDAAVERAVSASIAPLLRKQHELETRLEREALERQRLRDEVERLRQVTISWTAPAATEALPAMLDGARRGRRVLVAILLIVATLLIGTASAALLSNLK
jgi:hypothetical protein